MPNTYNQPFSQVLQTATWIDQIISGWTPEQLISWATTYPDSVEMVINDYGYCLITHPEFPMASPQDQQAAQDVFRSHMDNFGEYVNPQTLNTILFDLSMMGNLDSIDAIIDNITDDQELFIAPHSWGGIIEQIANSFQYYPEVTQDEANTSVRSIMENLSSNQFADIAQIVDISQLGMVMEMAGYNGNLELIDAIKDNLSDDAVLFISPFTWGNIINGIIDTHIVNPEVTVEQMNTVLSELMVQLSTNPFADIAQIVDVSALGLAMERSTYYGNLESIDIIADNLSDEAELFIAPYTWSNIIQSLADAPLFNPEVTQAEANALAREVLERLASNQFADIAQIVDAGQLGYVMENVGYNGNIELIDAITDNLSDDAELFIAPFTWSNIIQSLADAPLFNPEVTQAEANALAREVLERLASNQFADIAQIVDVGQLGYVMENAGYNGNIELIDAITDNLSDDAELFIAPFTWSNIIQSLADAPLFNPEVTQAEANALAREVLERLASNQFADIAQIVDVGQLGYVMENAGYNGNIELIDAITDNLSDDAELFIAPFTWSNIIQSLADAPLFNPEVTQAEANALAREVLERLASNQFADIAQIVDVGQLGYVMENAGYNGNIELIDAITDNLSDDAELFINPFTWGNVVNSILDAQFIDPSVTAEDVTTALREVMEQLANNQFADISQIADMSLIGLAMDRSGYYGLIDAVDAITDNLSDDAQLFIDPFTWSNTIQSVSDMPLFNPEVTQTEANAQLREIMEGLADNQLSDISQIVDVTSLNYTTQNLAQNSNFEAADAILDNLSDDALLFIDTVALEGLGVDVGSNLSDTLWDSAGTFEALYGLDGNDFVIGGNGDTSLYGGDGADYVYDFGSADNDIISGGDGADYLYGAGGADSFVFYQGETGVDTIWVFNSAEGDRLNINDYLEQYDLTQHAIEDFVILTEVNNNTTVSVDVDGQGAGGSQDLVTLNGVTSLTIDDVIDTSSMFA